MIVLIIQESHSHCHNVADEEMMMNKKNNNKVELKYKLR